MKICSKNVDGCIFVTVVFQIIVWTVVSGLLFYRGINNLWVMNSNVTIFMSNDTISSNLTSVDVPVRGYTTGVVMIVIASIMLVIGPTFFIVVLLEKCYRRKRFRKIPEEDPPPNYEDVVLEEMSPRYSTLFLNTESHGESLLNSDCSEGR